MNVAVGNEVYWKYVETFCNLMSLGYVECESGKGRKINFQISLLKAKTFLLLFIVCCQLNKYSITKGDRQKQYVTTSF